MQAFIVFAQLLTTCDMSKRSPAAVAASLLAGLGLVAKEALLMTFRAPSSATSLPAASSSPVVDDKGSEQPDRNLLGNVRNLRWLWTPQVQHLAEYPDLQTE